MWAAVKCAEALGLHFSSIRHVSLTIASQT